MKTKAAIAWQARAPLAMEQLELQGFKADEVLVKLKATGIFVASKITLAKIRSDNIDDLVTHRLRLERISDGLDLMRAANRSVPSSCVDGVDMPELISEPLRLGSAQRYYRHHSAAIGPPTFLMDAIAVRTVAASGALQ